MGGGGVTAVDVIYLDFQKHLIKFHIKDYNTQVKITWYGKQYTGNQLDRAMAN